MFFHKKINLILIVLMELMGIGVAPLLQAACADEIKIADSNPLIEWESTPRKISSGNSGQLQIRASESMYLLHAGRDSQERTNVVFSNSHNIGDSFGHSHVVSGETEKVSSHGENGPQLEVGLGIEIYAAWEADSDIKFSRSMSFGRNFSPVVRINDDSGENSQSFFTMEVAPSGDVYIAWLDGRDKKTNRPGTSSLYIARSKDRGATFSKNMKVAGDICPCCRPSIAFGRSGEIFVAWRHVYAQHERVIVVASSKDGGETWSEPVRVTQQGWKINGCAHAGPSIRFVNGKLFVVWYTGRDNRASVKMAVSSDNGTSFQNVKEIQGKVLDPNHPFIAETQEEAWVIFQGRNPDIEGGWGPSIAWVSKISQDGEFSTPEPLPSSGKGISYPYLYFGTGGRVYATWTEFGKQGPEVVLCRGRFASGAQR